MANPLKDTSTVDATSYEYVFKKNVTIPFRVGGAIRCNTYSPKSDKLDEKFPVIVTYGPYGKDVHYK